MNSIEPKIGEEEHDQLIISLWTLVRRSCVEIFTHRTVTSKIDYACRRSNNTNHFLMLFAYKICWCAKINAFFSHTINKCFKTMVRLIVSVFRFHAITDCLLASTFISIDIIPKIWWFFFVPYDIPNILCSSALSIQPKKKTISIIA